MKKSVKLLCFVLSIVLIVVIVNTFKDKTKHEEILKEENYTQNYVVVNKIKNTAVEAYNVPKIVYDGLTLEELAAKLDKSLNSTLSGKGMLIASYTLEKGVDPYMAVAIILQETGCKWNCSYLVKSCNNVGGQKGSGCGSYSYFNSIDEGIMAFIDNLHNNYIAYGLTTPELINSKYAEDNSWSLYVNRYIEEIKAQ